MFIRKRMIASTLALASSPSFTLLSFSKSDPSYKIMVNYNGQADLLLSLQIYPDYYPFQFKQRSLYDYLTRVGKYMVVDSNTSESKKNFGKKFQKRIDELVGKITTFGPSLWNEDIYEGGLVNRNEQFWTSKKTDYLFLEQFIVDDYADPLFLVNKLPKHKNVVVTNFRSSRDPYTLFSEKVYSYFLNQKNGDTEAKKIAEELQKYYKNYTKLFPNNLYRSAKYIEFWNSFCSALQSSLSTLKNGKANGKQNGQPLSSFFKLASGTEKLFVPFSTNGDDETLAELFSKLIFSEEETSKLKEWISSSDKGNGEKLIDYLRRNKGVQQAQVQAQGTGVSVCSSPSAEPQKVHHPALEHQTVKGSSPTSEGTQKDLMVYLAQLAVALGNISKSEKFSSIFSSDDRKDFISNALENALEIAKNYHERLKNIRDYLKEAKIVDENFDPEKNCHKRDDSKTLALVSFPPSQLGAGNSTIQTVSKYPFIYNDLGLKEVLPTVLTNGAKKTSSGDKHSLLEDIFGIDDNGWWWKLGDSNFSENGFSKFSSTADSIIFLATEDDWNILNDKDNNPKLHSLKTLLKGSEDKKLRHSSYHLWNEGLRSPIALNLLLDNLVKILTEQFEVKLNENGTKSKYESAMDWGSYWSTQFVESKSSKTGANQSK